MFTSNQTIRWVENLARQEELISRGEKGSLDVTETKDRVLGLETAAFVTELIGHFQVFMQHFNHCIQEPELIIRCQRPSESLEGFALVRRSLRIVVGKVQPGSVQIHCEKMISEYSSRSEIMVSGLVEGRFGLFHDVQWSFLGTPATAEQIARHYFTEFIQVSRTFLDS